MLTTPQWYPTYIFGTIFITLALVWVPAALGLGRSRGFMSRRIVTRRRRAWSSCAVVLGRAQQVQYADQHYTNTKLFLQEGGPQKAYAFAQKLQHQRIGIVGSSEIIFGQYGFFGNRRPTKSNTSACPARTAPTAWRPPARSSSNGSTPATTTT